MADNLLERARLALTEDEVDAGRISELLAIIDGNDTRTAAIDIEINTLKGESRMLTASTENAYLELARLVPVNPLGNMTIGS